MRREIPAEFSLDKLLASLQKIDGSEEGDDGFYSTREWAEFWGCRATTAKNVLRQLYQEGRLESKRKLVQGIDGRRASIGVYRILPAMRQTSQRQ